MFLKMKTCELLSYKTALFKDICYEGILSTAKRRFKNNACFEFS